MRYFVNNTTRRWAVFSFWVLMFQGALCAQQVITTWAGTGLNTFNGSSGQPAAVNLNWPGGIASDRAGNIYITETYGCRIRKIDLNGQLTTIAGNGVMDHSGDGGLAVNASIKASEGIVVDSNGTIYFSEFNGNCIRKIDPQGIITTIAGPGNYVDLNDGGPAINASIFGPESLALDRNGNLYIAEQGHQRIRKINAQGIISTVAGNGIQGFSGDGGLATNATLNNPNGICLDDSGNIYFTDWGNYRVRKINSAGIISTIAGTGSGVYNGDNIPATAAGMVPVFIMRDSIGNLYVSDNNFRVRKINNSGIISTIAGNGLAGYNGEYITATSARLGNFVGLFIDRAGYLYICDGSNHRVRKLVDPSLPVSFIRLSAAVSGSVIRIQWETGDEWNLSHYVVEQSVDGIHFSDAGMLLAAGLHQYQLLQAQDPWASGLRYYRIRIADRDGRFSYSSVVPLKLNAEIQFTIAPNPASREVHIHLNKPTFVSQFDMYSMDGKRVYTDLIHAKVSNRTIRIPSLPSGFYQLVLSATDQQFSQQILIKQ